MKSDARHQTRFGTLFRFAVRGLGLLGLLAAAVGGVVTQVEAPAVFRARSLDQVQEVVRPLLDGSNGATAQIGAFLLLGGAAAVLLWLLVELLGGLFLVTGRKSAAGAGNALQVGLAVALVVVVNALSFLHFKRFDTTRDERFTLARALIDDLKKLDPNSPTTVVVLQKDKLSATDPKGKSSDADEDDDDALTSAAQQKITEKVLDLIDELRQHPDLSARFNVHVLHTKDELYEATLADLTEPLAERKGETDAERKARVLANRERQLLKAAVKAAPENSVFVTGNGRVQRLPFHQFYMLDKAASLAPEGGRTRYANLVLNPQGKAAFVRKLLDLEQKRPKVALLSIHPFLTSREADEEGAVFTAAGMRTALEQNGYEVVDVVLKKGWDGESQISAAAATYDESKLDEIEAEYLAASDAFTEATIQVQTFEMLKKRTETGTLAELDRIFRKGIGRAVTSEADRTLLLKRLVEPGLESWRNAADEAKKELAEKEPLYLKYLGDDKVLGNRRSADVRAKLSAAVADCDLLVLPRLTTVNLVGRFVINPPLFYLAKEQTDVVKQFLTAGKPVLFGLGPTQVGRAPRPGEDPPDDIEKMLARLGIEAGDQTIITPVEAAEMAKRRGGGAFGGKMPDLPPLQVDLQPRAGKAVNPVAAAFEQTSRTARKKLEVKRSGYRPLYVTPQLAARSPFTPELLLTTPDAWNEDRPLPEREYVPKYEPTKPDDPKKGTREEERKQAFVVGVAAEVPVPAEWVNPNVTAFAREAAVAAGGGPLAGGLPLAIPAALISPDDLVAGSNRKTVRVAVFGHGGLFNGPRLDAGQEALLLHTVNWQLRREERLPAAVPDPERWQYPRVPLDAKQETYWTWGAVLGLPLAAAFLGVIALMLRRLR